MGLPASRVPRLDAALVWFRRDLRDYDHAALSHALRDARRVYCAFVFDTEILDALESRADRRVEFIWESAAELHRALQRAGGGLILRHARAREEIPALAARLGVQAVYANHDYEPPAIERDLDVARALGAAGRELRTFKDQAIFDRDEVLSGAGTPFSVFSAYRRAWLARFQDADARPYPVARYRAALAPPPACAPPTLEALGFARTDLRRLDMATGMAGAQALLRDFRGRMSRYHERRDYPAVKGPSYLSVHLRFGTISVRELVRAARAAGNAGAAAWLSELIWRDFYFMILFHHPHVVEHAFRPGLDALAFRNDEGQWQAWCRGATGYPLVDAAMRQLDQTGYMHNRLRMLTASFLVKHLQVDWRRGERYFAHRLNDYDLAANNGGWQWAASTGCDAQPWFRIFNPVLQSRRFDAQGRFIRRYVPELARVPDPCIHAPWTMDRATQARAGVRIGRDYPAPIVDHAQARREALEMYRRVKGSR